jgi:hypothetical protein
VCGPCVDKYRIGRSGDALPTVAVHNLDVIKISEILTGTRRQLGVDLNANDMTGWPHDLGDDRRVIPDAATYVKDAIPFVKL